LIRDPEQPDRVIQSFTAPAYDFMAIDPTGRTLLLADGRGKPALWDIETGQLLAELPKQDHLIDRVVSPFWLFLPALSAPRDAKDVRKKPADTVPA
jgi:hypothetical protein